MPVHHPLSAFHIFLVAPRDPYSKLFKNYDTQQGIVVRATSAHRARRIASDNAGDEGRSVWLDSSITQCLVIGWDTIGAKEGIVLRSFKNG